MTLVIFSSRETVIYCSQSSTSWCWASSSAGVLILGHLTTQYTKGTSSNKVHQGYKEHQGYNMQQGTPRVQGTPKVHQCTRHTKGASRYTVHGAGYTVHGTPRVHQGTSRYTNGTRCNCRCCESSTRKHFINTTQDNAGTCSYSVNPGAFNDKVQQGYVCQRQSGDPPGISHMIFDQ